MRMGGAGPLLDARRFTKFAHNRAVRLGHKTTGDGIEHLWRVGWLLADLVRVTPGTAEAMLAEWAGEGFARVGGEGDSLLYADARDAGGWVGIEDVGDTPAPKVVPSGVQPLFHPFRYHVVHFIEKILRPQVTPLSTLTTAGPDSLASFYKQVFGHIDEHIKSAEFANDLRRVNDRTALAVTTEPLYFDRIFGLKPLIPDYGPKDLSLDLSAYRSLGRDELERLRRDLYKERLGQHHSEIQALYRQASFEKVSEVHTRLCKVSEELDPNRDLQTLLRITRGVGRLDLRGATGGALLTRTMAEMIRRAAEEIFETELLEEDQAGYVILRPGRPNPKEWRYGSARLLDGDRGAEIEFVRAVGLNVGDRVRWYVEGATEYWALAEVVGTEGEYGISLIDLHGQLAESDDVLSFRDSLRSDINHHIFSLVSPDGDDDKYLFAVRKAVDDGEFFGRFLVLEPDFELGNFTLDELEEVLCGMAVEHGAVEGEREKLRAALKEAERRQRDKGELFKGKHIEKAAKNALLALNQFSKGQEWGRRLMACALEYPQTATGETRPMIEAIDVAAMARRASYASTKRGLQVDRTSGRLLAKIPDVSGLSVFAASALLEEGHLRVKGSQPVEGVASEVEGERQLLVAGTEPPVGTLLEPGSEIVLLLEPVQEEQ